MSQAHSPAKLILSGEHSVVYGTPAIGMTLNCYMKTTIKPAQDENIVFHLHALAYDSKLSFAELKALKQRLDTQEILSEPAELAQYAVALFLDQYALKLEQGFSLDIHSDIPIGLGMGSSAAMIISLILALSDFFDCSIDALALGRQIEDLQHGKSSGFDLLLSLKGGIIYKQSDGALQVFQSNPILEEQMQLINTGAPVSNTAACVNYAAQFFNGSSDLLSSFSKVTEAFKSALEDKNVTSIKDCIRENHQLLVKIGVVPDRLQEFIKVLESQNIAAKICGSGAISGEHAGIVLAVTDQDIVELVHQYKYELLDIKGGTNGTRLL